VIAQYEAKFIVDTWNSLSLAGTQNNSGKESGVARILIVEDEANIVKLISIRLARLGHSINSADNGSTALAIARESTPDLILLDVMIPVQNGFQVLQQLKADPVTAPIPVLMLTARGHERDTPDTQATEVTSCISLP